MHLLLQAYGWPPLTIVRYYGMPGLSKKTTHKQHQIQEVPAPLGTPHY